MNENDLNIDSMLTENWNDTRDALVSGLSGSKKEIVEQVLNNSRNYLMESATPGAVVGADIANYRKTLLPLIRRIIPGTIGTELVGVQAMNGPVDQVYSMRYEYKEAVTHNPARSQFGGYDIASGDEVFGNTNPLRQFYSGTVGADQDPGASGFGPPGTDGTSANADIDAATATGDAWGGPPTSTDYTTGTTLYGEAIGGFLRGGSNSHIEGSGGRKMGLKLIGQAVEAKGRKLQASWTPEAMYDLKNQHGLSMENEMTKAMTSSIVQEIDAEIINDLLALAGTVRAWDYANTIVGYTPTFIGDRFANIAARITEVANEVGRKTRKQAANWMVISPMMVSVLQTAAKSVFAPAVAGSFAGPTDTKLVGTLNGSIKVYSYLWNQAYGGSSSPAGDDKMLLGLKGGNGELDAGYFYCPYLPVTATGVITHPETFQQVMSLATRYGKAVFTDPTTSLGNSADYYARINVSNIDFV